ncbi:uncharacterized protein LOC6569301 [Drosophila grimshawi]|uniref:GH17821 n=1 Tax=Drosophila grimshawi TaxID=7222 RepID=B4JWU5_DROGR|nr:uncharacterized protein LOC6569301 [Drosophila grimshawi]EDV95221.1 GH17821 [Drosophila grimshawi]
MAEHNMSYEQECQRAELLGQEPPDQAEFERQRSARIEQQMAEMEVAEATMLEEQEESLRGAGGKLDELNSILNSTQQRLNRFKQTACGSLSNLFARGGSISGASDVPNNGGGGSGGEEPTRQQPVERQPKPQPLGPPTAAEVAAAKAAKSLRMDTQLDKLDALINKADNAQLAMGEQTKQMRRMAK